MPGAFRADRFRRGRTASFLDQGPAERVGRLTYLRRCSSAIAYGSTRKQNIMPLMMPGDVAMRHPQARWSRRMSTDWLAGTRTVLQTRLTPTRRGTGSGSGLPHGCEWVGWMIESSLTNRFHRSPHGTASHRRPRPRGGQSASNAVTRWSMPS
jgi:hypothetical protein